MHLRCRPLGWQICNFVLQTQASASSKHGYAKTLRAIAKRLGHQSLPVLDLLIAGLAVSANRAPIQQAHPASPAHVNLLVARAWTHDPTGRLAMSIYLAWKTASRWADLLSLTKNNFVQYDPHRRQLIVEWGDLKTNRRERFRSSMLTVVQEDNNPSTLATFDRVIRSLRPGQPLCPMSTDQFRLFLHGSRATQQLGAHSIKRGAANRLMSFAASRRLDPRLVPLLLKHRDALHEFPASTLRYIDQKADLARALRTQEATRLL